ncbi:MAG: glycine--tRNA ligase, partial [bacterium]
IKKEWWKRFVHSRTDMVGIDAALLMNPKVWQASGHVAHFTDPLVEDKKTHERFRADHLLEGAGINTTGMSLEQMTEEITKRGIKSPHGNELTDPKTFNLMLETYLGPIKDEDNKVYLRPETAQAMFVDFPLVSQTTRKKLPFGIAQIGKAFRNEITPGNFIFRTREFEQMEIEYFCKENEWQQQFDHWLNEMKEWLKFCGVKENNLVFREIPDGERAHYSKRTVDIEYQYPFGQKELYGIAYRGDYDLKRHQEVSGQDMRYFDQENNDRFLPHVIEPTFGVDRTVLVCLLEAYHEEEAPTSDNKMEIRSVLKLPKALAPYKVAILPLSKKEELTSIAKPLWQELTRRWFCDYDETQSIGKRYRRQDEIGTPYCITVDFDSLEDKQVTVRDRDTMKQERIKIVEVKGYLADKLN